MIVLLWSEAIFIYSNDKLPKIMIKIHVIWDLCALIFIEILAHSLTKVYCAIFNLESAIKEVWNFGFWIESLEHFCTNQFYLKTLACTFPKALFLQTRLPPIFTNHDKSLIASLFIEIVIHPIIANFWTKNTGTIP